MTSIRPHDLLRIEDVRDLVSNTPAPNWVAAELAVAPWAVVRRAPAPPGWVAVGIRGSSRRERWAALLRTRSILELWPPEAVAARLEALPLRRRTDIPAIAAVGSLAAALARLQLQGGPTGSVGFELVSGRATATEASDLDAIVRAEAPMARSLAAELAAEIAGLSARCDLLLETPNGAVALAEYVRGPGPVALREPQGPRMVSDPWANPNP
jgi:phosphoribosyl-dephospho-CoA transferase